MKKTNYQSMDNQFSLKRREFLKTGSVVGAGMVLGSPAVWQEKKYKSGQPDRIKTNIDDFIKMPRTDNSLPGFFPGKVVQVGNKNAMTEVNPDPEIINQMILTGLEKLTDKTIDESFSIWFDKEDIVGIKVNPVGAGLISTRLEVVDSVIN